MYQVVITDCDHPSLRIEHEILGAAGATVRLEQCRGEAEVVERCADADALLVQYAPVRRAALAGLPRCRVVVRYGVGYDSLDIPAHTAAGVWACNVPDYSTDEVATLAITLLLALNRRLVPLANATVAGRWDCMLAGPIERLAGQTLGIIGYGRIGRAVATKVRGLGLHLLATDPYVAPDEVAATGARAVSLTELLETSDYVSLHLPLAEDSRHLIDRSALQRMRTGASLINTARGGLVDEEALLEALTSARLAGAALDVLEQEPPPGDHPLLRAPNCLVLPHSAWYSAASFVELKTKAAQEIVRVFQGLTPRYALNPEVRPRHLA